MEIPPETPAMLKEMLQEGRFHFLSALQTSILFYQDQMFPQWHMFNHLSSVTVLLKIICVSKADCIIVRAKGDDSNAPTSRQSK